MKRSKHGLFVFPPKKTLIWRRHYSIGQSCYSMTSKRSIGWFLESSRAWSFFTRAFAKPTKGRARLYPFDKPIKSFHFRSFVVSVLFARFSFQGHIISDLLVYVIGGCRSQQSLWDSQAKIVMMKHSRCLSEEGKTLYTSMSNLKVYPILQRHLREYLLLDPVSTHFV